MSQKRQLGSYYTQQNPFEMRPFKEWAKLTNLDKYTVLEPFAGTNNIVHMLQNSHSCDKFACYDIATNEAQNNDQSRITRQDTLKSFPSGYDVCITNPPWLARNSARRRGLRFDAPAIYDGMYKYALHLALAHCKYAAFIIPATFLRSCLFRDRLHSFVLLERNIFDDTNNPVCLALFVSKPRRATVWADNTLLGYLDDLEKKY